jgi:hypothetical protein
MTFKTKARQIWESPLHPVWIVLAMLEIGVLVLCIDRFVFHGGSFWKLFRWAGPPFPQFFMQDIYRLLWVAYVDAGGIRVSEGISAFNGTLVRGTWRPEHALVIVSMILSYIVGPSLFLWGLVSRKKWISKKPATPSKLRILGATALGGYIIFFALLMPVEGSLGSWTAWQRMKADSYANGVRDGAIASISTLGFQAQQLRLMPEARGGGPWVQGEGAITIADLDTVLPRIDRGLWSRDDRAPMKYLLEVHSPDSLTIWGVANAHGGARGTTFLNIDGTSGNIQVHAGVTPLNVTTMTDN